MKILYKKILDLEVWHDYFLGQPDPPKLPQTDYEISDLLGLLPTLECLQLLQNLHWVFRPQTHGANLFAQVNETPTGDFQTVIPVDLPLRLTFWLVVRNRYFANFTNLPLTTSRNQIYYFSNLSGNQGHNLFLTQPLPTYAAKNEYHLGDLVTHDGQFVNHDDQLVNYNGNLEALHYQASASGSAIPEASDWEPLPTSQYVSVLDQLPLQGLSRNHAIASGNPGETFRFVLIDVNQQETFAYELTVADNHPPGEAINLSLNFAGQPPGRYQLSLNGTQVDEFVLLDPIANKNAFALVEIVLNQSLVPAEFRLLEASLRETSIRPKTYVIRFKNRATRWRYKYEPQKTQGLLGEAISLLDGAFLGHGFCLEGESPETDGCDLIDSRFVVLDRLSYATERPVGLRQQPEQLLNDGKKDLPAPGVAMIKPIKSEIDGDRHVNNIFSDVHM